LSTCSLNNSAVGVSPDVYPRVASNGEDNNEDSEDYYNNNGHLLPIVLQRCQHTCFACATAIAKLVPIVAPKPTVGIRIVCRRGYLNSPHGGINKRETARRRRLATSRLHTQHKPQCFNSHKISA